MLLYNWLVVHIIANYWISQPIIFLRVQPRMAWCFLAADWTQSIHYIHGFICPLWYIVIMELPVPSRLNMTEDERFSDWPGNINSLTVSGGLSHLYWGINRTHKTCRITSCIGHLILAEYIFFSAGNLQECFRLCTIVFTLYWGNDS